MQQRKSGTQGLTVSALGLGCMAMSAFYGPRDESESVAASDVYGPHTNKVLAGRTVKPHRDDWRYTSPRFQGDNFQKNLDLVTKIEEFAEKRKVKASQLALAWVLAQGEDVVPIPGTKRIEFLEENVGALAVRLSADDLARLDDVLPPGAAKGSRYPEAQMKSVHL